MEEIKFRSRRDIWILMVLFFTVGIMIFPLIPAIPRKMDLEILIIGGVILLITALLFWIIYGTNYTVTNSQIIYRSGPIHGKIPIEAIHTIVSGKTLYVGFRPATAGKGVVIKYNKYDEIYFSPDTNEKFIEEVLKRNPKITIEE